jgi:hypothetical protein
VVSGADVVRNGPAIVFSPLEVAPPSFDWL